MNGQAADAELLLSGKAADAIADPHLSANRGAGDHHRADEVGEVKDVVVEAAAEEVADAATGVDGERVHGRQR